MKQYNSLNSDQKAFVNFLAKAFLLYGTWYLFRILVLSPFTQFDEWLINVIVTGSVHFLSFLQNEPITIANYLSTPPYFDSLYIGQTGGVRVGEACDGIGVIATFSIFVIAYPGNKKIPFLILGILNIHLLNVLRVSALCLIQKFAPEFVEFNHKYTFTILVYSAIFALWYLYAKYFKKVAPTQP